ncbi:hypothetical protein E2C01_019342 [Portunus trituberculatus]|uniref:Uncharacterized protein n=1 Tax=Portunus trituberculatus TaxID=210409 RepID=A0A5B7DXM9_PORTR|nr:hypothetical protein [Portunus trituberculatus]
MTVNQSTTKFFVVNGGHDDARPLEVNGPTVEARCKWVAGREQGRCWLGVARAGAGVGLVREAEEEEVVVVLAYERNIYSWCSFSSPANTKTLTNA